MFRSLRTRLVAYYVSAAILLVIVAALSVTVFALSMFGITSRESLDSAARETLDEAQTEVARFGSLAKAAPSIARDLARPGLRIAVTAYNKDGTRRFLAGAHVDGPNGEVVMLRPPRPGPLPEGGPVGPPPGGGAGRASPDRGSSIPMILNIFMRVQPRLVEIKGGRVSIFPEPTQLARFVGTFWMALGIVAVFVVLAAWFAGRYIAEQALRPLVETTASLNRFAAGDFTPRAIVTSARNEVGELVAAYNGAVAQVAAAFEERRNVEMQMRQFIADAGHELRTPLTVIMGFVDVLRRRGGNESVATAKIFDTIAAESRRIRALVDKLIALARLENPQVHENEPVELDVIARRVVDALQLLQNKSRIALHSEHGLVVRADEHEMYEAIANLVENALKYAPLSPVEVTVRAEGDRAAVVVADRGPGLSDEDREHIFDRFYRGVNRGETEGSGLGLAIVKRAVERAGGEVEVDSREGYGCRFTIRLPRERGEDARIAV